MIVKKNAQWSREEFFVAFSRFLRELAGDDARLDPEPTTHLWEAQYLDSFAMVQVIVYLEELLGREIRLEADGLPSFYTLERIYEAHVRPAGEPRR